MKAIPDSINKGVMKNRSRLLTQDAIFIYNNLMANTWEHLRHSLASSTEALFVLLGLPEKL